MNHLSTRQFIADHRLEDVRLLALQADKHPDVDMPFALDQIQGWQTARGKLPTWANTEGILFPPHLSMEQCSSETTARYKQRLVEALGGADMLADLTGGFGVDFSFMARGAGRAVYIERNEHLCALARHNFPLLGLPEAEVVCGDGVEWLHDFTGASAGERVVVFIDPARRDAHGQRVFGLSDCTPDVTLLRQELLEKASAVIIKLSPMLDWHAAVEAMAGEGRGTEVHIVSVSGECKELLLVLTHGQEPLRVVCACGDVTFSYSPGQLAATHPEAAAPRIADEVEGVLLVPDAAIMKAGCFAEIAHSFDAHPLDPNSHLFVAPRETARFPGRQFQIEVVSSFNKRDLRTHLAGISQANIAVRNFPLSAADLRRRLKLKDGGSHYLFATTWLGRHVIIMARKNGIGIG